MTTIKESSSSTSVVSSSSSTGSAATVISSTLSKQTVASTASLQELKDQDKGLFSAKMVYVKRKDSADSLTTSSSASEETWSVPKLPPVAKYPAYQHEGYRSFSTENAKPSMLRRYSEDVLSERRGDDEVAQRFGQSSVKTQQQRRRLQMETQQLKQKEEERRMEQEKRALAKQRIELELAKTRAELEEEEKEDRLHDRTDTSSITSDYSTTSSSVHDSKPHSTPLSSHSDYSSNASPSSLRYHDPHCLNSSAPLRHSIHDDLDLYRRKDYNTDFDTSRIAGKGTLSRRKGPQNASVRRTIEESEDVAALETFQRSGSYKRKGSLDSLREHYTHGERGYVSSDSEHGDDMVQALTATFDQKLKTFSDKHKGLGKEGERGAPEGAVGPTMLILPKPVPYNRGDPKVGIASRFERKDSASGTSPGSSSWSSPKPQGYTADHTYAQLSSPVAAHRPDHSWASPDNRTAISKSEKTDANRQQQVRDAQACDYVAALRKSSEKIFGSRERLLEEGEGEAQAAGKKRDPTKKRPVERRHTVGGTSDPEHFMALLTLHSQDDTLCKPTWEQAPGQQPPMYSLKSWVEEERRRTLGSSPAIFSHFLLQPMPDHSPDFPPKFAFESAI